MAIFDFNNLSSLSDVELSVYRFVVNNPEKYRFLPDKAKTIALLQALT